MATLADLRIRYGSTVRGPSELRTTAIGGTLQAGMLPCERMVLVAPHARPSQPLMSHRYDTLTLLTASATTT